MGTMKTPGVYIVEKNAFPNSVVEVATAVPAFIGYTDKADNKGKTLFNKAKRITSMSEFHTYYGFAPKSKFTINEITQAEAPEVGEAELKGDAAKAAAAKAAAAKAAAAKLAEAGGAEAEVVEADFTLDKRSFLLELDSGEFLLYRCMQLFFQNGGGPCYIVSVGDYKTGTIDVAKLEKGIEPLIKEQEPTMVVIPETVRLSQQDSQKVQGAAVMHCGDKMKSRVAILDIREGFKDQQETYLAGGKDLDCVSHFREDIGINQLKFAIAYYPWVNTSVVVDTDLNFDNVENKVLLVELLKEEAGIPEDKGGKDVKGVKDAASKKREAQKSVIAQLMGNSEEAAVSEMPAELLNNSLIAMSPLYKNIMTAIKFKLNQLPPAAAMAGIYTMVDNSRGVWKAPANVSMASVVSPAVNISHEEQENLNVDTNGKSINAIRSFIGEGTLVWGARTLDGNSLDWRYINVRRTMIMLEESIRLASKAYVFEPNDANTWVTMKSMIRNFLTGIWKRGGLAGAVPDEAFSVHVGLGDTMTAEDILEGRLLISVFVAVSRPAEFIEITFQQQMQKS